MNNSISISSRTARRLVLKSQLLHESNVLPEGKEGLLEVIGRLGYIQIDTISVVNRSHHHTLWSRMSEYEESMLHDLQAKDRAVFEYWAHAMSYLPISDFRYYLPKMENFKNPTHPWIRHHWRNSLPVIQDVLKRIREEGPLSSKDFQDTRGKRSGWWDWKPAKAALELLFWQGEIMVKERRNFQKVFDLTERVLPSTIDRNMPSKEELGRFLVRRALKALGMAMESEIQRFLQPGASRDADLRLVDGLTISRTIQEFLESGEVTPLRIENDSKADFYAFSKNQEIPGDAGSWDRVSFLSPFDNIVIQRDRIRRLFQFDYTLECYVSPEKRRHGYFVFPILWGDRFVGRLDPKADRKNKTLILNGLNFESGFKDSPEFWILLASRLEDMARFNGCERLEFGMRVDSRTKRVLDKYCKKNEV